MARKCLICEAPITQIHMGIDACRACAVFYRRACRSQCKFRCRSSTGRCVQEGRVLECRCCRFDAMQSIFDKANLEIPTAPNSNHRSEPECSSDFSPPASTFDSPTTPSQREIVVVSPRCAEPGPSTSSTPVLDRIRCGYNVMTRIRKSAELCMRPLDKFVHPTAIDDNTFPIIDATYGLTFRTTQIMISSLFDFASIAFPDFETLSRNEKWHLISGCHERVFTMESTFRAVKIFPDDERIFVSYTMTLSVDTADVFLSDCPKNINSEEAKKALMKNLEDNPRRCKRAMSRTNPTDEEFLVLIALSFWNTEIPSNDERLSKIAIASRTAIMQDLHNYYTSRGITDYATRIGELFCLLVANEKLTTMITEDIELLRLMDTRKCLICGAPITQIHMGIDACRACAVFYRRARRSKCKFRCKSSTGRCVQEGRVLECRRCRFNVMHSIFERANLEIIPAPHSNHRSEPECSSELSPPPSSSDAPATPPQTLLQLLQQPRPISPIRCPDIGPSTSSTPVLDRIRCGYNVMTRIRKSTELCMRPLDKFVHPTAIDDNSFPIIPATYGLTFRTTQILISSLFDFASIAFPEFETLDATEKWHLISGCYERVHIIESTFRCTKLFPEDGRVFVSYTMTLSSESVDVFLSDCPKNVNSAEARTTLQGNLDATVSGCKRAMRRTDPTDEEFLVMLALSFWNTDSPFADERLNRMATASRTAIMQDLHAYYSSRGVTDYASRIGELFCLLVTNERVTSLITEDTELLRLMDVYQQPRF